MKRLLAYLFIVFGLTILFQAKLYAPIIFIPSQTQEVDKKETIPEWYIKIPKATDKIMYDRGTALSKNSQSSKNEALKNALVNFAGKLKSKITITEKQAGTGENIVKKRISKIKHGNYIITCIALGEDTTKCEDNRDLFNWNTLSGYTLENTETKQLANGDYRSFILIKYPIDKAYKEYAKLLNL